MQYATSCGKKMVDCVRQRVIFNMTPFLFLILYFANTIYADNVLGCGGFVKSDVDINFSLVEVKLYTTHGSIKYQTDCAPNTGYYLIPLYEKADFVLKVEPPKGWSFEPDSVVLKVDGSTDKCSLGEDINFKFTGFTISGKVISKGQSEGPAGIQVTLTKAGSTEVLQTVTTEEGGSYSFSKVMPGDYDIKAAETPGLKFLQGQAKVSVKADNADVGSKLVIAGYTVTGSVKSEGEPIKGVNFVLFSKGFGKEDINDCDKSLLPGFTHSEAIAPLCFATSREDGTFVYPSIPVGEFFIIPFYKGEHIKFDVRPGKLEFKVPHGPFVLQQVFQVEGFSVTGKVLNSEKGAGLGNAQIWINGKKQTKTAKDGTYHLENMKTGTYQIKVELDNIFFDELSVKITPNTPLLPDMIATGFSMCGQIVIDKIPEGLKNAVTKRRVIIYPEGKSSDASSVVTDAEGKFCTKVKSGNFVVKVHTTDEEIKAGLQITPSEKKVTVKNAPTLDIKFTQFRAKITGSVKCLERCGNMDVSLDAVGRSDLKQVAQVKETPQGSVFQFDDVMPGKYKVTLLHDAWCWKEKSVDIEVLNSDISGIEIVQTGYILKCTISHEIKLHFAHEKKEGIVGSFQLNKGSNRFCLSQPGIYKLTTDSCHKFEKDIYTYDTANPEVLTLTAVKHLVEGAVTTDEKVEDITVTVLSLLDKTPVVLGPLTADQKEFKDGKAGTDATKKTNFAYRFSHWARHWEKLEFSVSSRNLLFSPPKMELTVQGETCPGEVVQFTGKRGVFIVGHIKPKLEGVEVTVVSKDGSTDPVTIETSENKDFKIGPLHSSKEYEVSAKKAGYILVKEKGESAVFSALKLGEISVQVSNENKDLLPDVLISLSGDKQYRSNNVTNSQGTVVFSELSPGQYFLRPMMKEYKFEPASQMIDVLEGTTMNIKIKGHRVAFSCYGQVTSLNGEAEPGVIVEAMGQGQDCSQYQEESKTEQDGTYRIRGLQPKCKYDIRLKPDVNKHIDRASPKSRMLLVENSDFVDVNIIAFRKMNNMDISGNVVTSEEYLPSLKVQLFRDDNLDSPVHTVSLGVVSFFYLPSLQNNNEKYILKLESTLSRSAYSYDLPEVSFNANTSYKHVTFKFSPKRKSLEQELSQGSILALPFTLLVAFAIYNYQKLLPMLSKGFVQARSMLTVSHAEQNVVNGSGDASSYSFDSQTSSKKKSKPRKTS